MFHNTTHETGQLLFDFMAKSKSDEERIYELFCEKNVPMSWSEVSGCLEINEVSLKRCLTDLCTQGKLVKTTDKTISKYGRPCYRYKLNKI